MIIPRIGTHRSLEIYDENNKVVYIVNAKHSFGLMESMEIMDSSGDLIATIKEKFQLKKIVKCPHYAIRVGQKRARLQKDFYLSPIDMFTISVKGGPDIKCLG